MDMLKGFSMKKFVKMFIVLLVLLAVLAQADIVKRPNIVYILADDMSYDSVSAYNDKIGNMKTPCLDRLVSQGMSFTDAHSGSSVCTPTRYGIMTGRYCWRTELKKEVLWDYGRPLIEKERLTVADLLKEQGYNTGMVGKWHLGMDWYDKDGKPANAHLKIADAIWRKGDGSADRVKACEERIDWSKPITGGPVDNGFDYYFGVDLPNFPPYAWIENDRLTAMPTVPKPKEMFGTDGPMVEGWKLEDILPTLAVKSAEYIKEQSKKDKPFFLYVPLTSPHTPIAPSKKFLGKSGISKYADFVIETDWVVGHIVEAIDKAGIADNTMVIFTTDNGTATACSFKTLEKHGVDLHNHYRGHKSQIYEGGHRLPFIVRWPGVVKAGSTCGQTICHTDLIATVADMFGVTLGDNAGEDSYSILGLLTGKETYQPYRPMVVHHDYRGNFAIRNGKWKLIETDKKELYDLEADVKETTNIAEKRLRITQHLSGMLKKYKEEGRSRLKAGIPKVLIIGDSISLGYTPDADEMLEGKAAVMHHKGNRNVGPNGGPTIRGVEYIDEWLGGEKWDVIHFNWGLWDMYGWHYEKHDRSPEAYEKRLDKLVTRLKQTGAKLIWATTTPVCPGPENLCKLTISKETERKYLDAALRVMKAHGVAVNDLHGFMEPLRKKYGISDTDVHFTREGSKKLAEQVVKHIEAVLGD